jgi:hypothetical protein
MSFLTRVFWSFSFGFSIKLHKRYFNYFIYINIIKKNYWCRSHMSGGCHSFPLDDACNKVLLWNSSFHCGFENKSTSKISSLVVWRVWIAKSWLGFDRFFFLFSFFSLLKYNGVLSFIYFLFNLILVLFITIYFIFYHLI